MYIFRDSVVFVILHFGLFALFFYAIHREQIMKLDMVSVRRGKEGWNYFYIAYGILSIIVIQIISLSEFGKGYKVLFAVMDLAILLYLTFFNSWFRNKTMGFVVASQNKEE